MIKRGDVYYADLSGVVGSEQGGIRPVVVIQNDKGKDLPIVNFELKLEHEVRSDIYDYFAN